MPNIQAPYGNAVANVPAESLPVWLGLGWTQTVAPTTPETPTFIPGDGSDTPDMVFVNVRSPYDATIIAPVEMGSLQTWLNLGWTRVN